MKVEPLTVGKLREILATLPDDMKVVVPSYETGFHHAGASVESIVFNEAERMGRRNEHQSLFGDHEASDGEGSEPALILDTRYEPQTPLFQTNPNSNTIWPT